MSHAFNEVVLKLIKALLVQEQHVQELTALLRAGEPTEPPELDLDAMADAAMARLQRQIDDAARAAQIQTSRDFAQARDRCLPHLVIDGSLIVAGNIDATGLRHDKLHLEPYIVEIAPIDSHALGSMRWIDPRRTT